MVATVIKIRIALNEALQVTSYFVSSYLNSLSDFSKVISLFTEDKFKEIVCLSFDSFKNNLYSYRQGIFTYWNGESDLSNLIELVRKGAHTVYVKKTLASFYAVYNIDGESSKSFRFTSIYQNSTTVESPIKYSTQYIYGYVWRKI